LRLLDPESSQKGLTFEQEQQLKRISLKTNNFRRTTTSFDPMTTTPILNAFFNQRSSHASTAFKFFPQKDKMNQTVSPIEINK